MKKLKKTIVKLAAISMLTGYAPLPVQANDEGISACDVGDCNPTGSFRATGKTRSGTSYGSFVLLASNVTGASSNGQVLSGSKSYTYSNSVSGAMSGSYDAISATLGFSITASSTLTASYSIQLNKNQKGRIFSRPVYEVYTVPYERYWAGTAGCNFWASAGTATVYRFVSYDYKAETWY